MPRPNYALEQSVMRFLAAPPARSQCVPTARKPMPRAAANRGR